jgi:MarR family transcriptional regulator, organic hydroperoxide resistance regulator
MPVGKAIPAAAEAEEAINNRLFFRFFRAANTLHTKGTQALQARNTTTQQWSVLGALSRPQAAEGMTVRELCEYLLVSRQNLSGILDRLERDSSIQRMPGSEDRRTKRVRLTRRGEKLWADLRPLIYGFYDDALEGFSLDDRLLFIEYVSRLQHNMSAI